MNRPIALRWVAAGATAVAAAAITLLLPLSPASAADNLSLSGGADGSSKASGTSYGNVKDGSTSTYWSPASATGYVSVKWGSALTVSSAVIRQASGGGSINAWRLLNYDTGAVLASGSGSPSTISFASTCPVASVNLYCAIRSSTSSTAGSRTPFFETMTYGRGSLRYFTSVSESWVGIQTIFA